MNARVIDCDTRKIVPMVSSCRFSALSYVWGHDSTMDDLPEAKGRVPERLPRTIEDAMTVTKELGLHYLWVDRYCIEQYHSEDKLHQLNQMANIYNNVIVTLCGLAPHDDFGLPGVSRERPTYPSFTVNDTLISSCPSFGSLWENLEKSTWSTRGWTYQEALLSRRCIFFTQEQSFLVCRSSCQPELVPPSYTEIGPEFLVLDSNILTIIMNRGLQGTLRGCLTFNQYVQQFQKRHFKVDSDALAAFKGVLSIADDQSYYGIPVFDCRPSTTDPLQGLLLRAGFVHGLLWYVWDIIEPNENNFRTVVPSWTWLSRRRSLPRFRMLEPAVSRIKNRDGLACASGALDPNAFVADIWAELADKSMIKIEDLFASRAALKVVAEQSHFLQICSILVDFEIPLDLFTLEDGPRFTSKLGDARFGNIRFTSDICLLYDCEIGKKISQYNGIRNVTGTALLLFAESDSSTNKSTVRNMSGIMFPGFESLINESMSWNTYWMVVERTNENTYQRIGLIWSRLSLVNYVEEYGDKRTTIRLA